LKVSKQKHAGTLTVEQVATLQLAVRGLSDSETAARLHISVSTVRRRLQVAAKTLGVPNRVALAARAGTLGLIRLPENAECE